MEHVIFWPGQDATPSFARVPSLDEAVAVVERLRNDDGVVGATVHCLVEVPLSFRTYYHVEVPRAAAAAIPPQTDAGPAVLAVIELPAERPAEPLAGSPAPPEVAVPAVEPPHPGGPQLSVVPRVDEESVDLAEPVPRAGVEQDAPAPEQAAAPGRGLGFFAR